MKTSTTKCGKSKNEYCRLHNPEPAGFTEANRKIFIRQALIAERMRRREGKKPACAPESEALQSEEQARLEVAEQLKAKEHAWLVEDMEKNMKLTVNPKTGEKTVSVFRAGPPEAPKERGVEKQSYLDCDAHMPEGRQDRTSGIFASPTMNGVTAWVRGVSHIVKDWGVRELRVNPDEVYVYSVRAWEQASFRDSNEQFSKAYWETGVTLTQWMEKLRKDPDLDPQEWELLLSPNHLKSVKPVGADRVSRSAYMDDNGERNENIYRLLTKELGKKG